MNEEQKRFMVLLAILKDMINDDTSAGHVAEFVLGRSEFERVSMDFDNYNKSVGFVLAAPLDWEPGPETNKAYDFARMFAVGA